MIASNSDSSCIVLTNFNGLKNNFLEKCLDTLAKSLDLARRKSGLSPDLVVVDDGSYDNSVKHLREFKDKVAFNIEIISTPNLDVTGAMNSGIRHVFNQYPECRFLVTLDVDIVLSESFLLEIVGYAKNTGKRIGMIASNQYMLSIYPDKNLHRSTGHFVSVAGATLDRDFEDACTCKGKKIICPCFSGALFKIEMLKEIGLVPKDYIHYNNCTELGLRAQLNDWKVEFAESAVMWHHYRSSEQITKKQKQNREISRIWNILRFFPRDKIRGALDAYRFEHFSSSPTLEEKKEIIRKAKDLCPQIPECDQAKKIIYKQFIDTSLEHAHQNL